MNEAVIALGSNLGAKMHNIENAIVAINNLIDTEIIEISKKYQTKPFKVTRKQEKYINCCVKIKTNLPPLALLGACLGIEASMGRKRVYENAPRIIDLDLLFYENVKMNSEHLVLPHPKIHERAFVMIPLADIYPDKKVFDFDFKDHLDTIDRSGIKLII